MYFNLWMFSALSLPQLLILSKGEDLNDAQMVQQTQSDKST